MNAELTSEAQATPFNAVLDGNAQFKLALKHAHESCSYIIVKIGLLQILFGICSGFLKHGSLTLNSDTLICLAFAIVLQAVLLLAATARVKTRYSIKNDKLCAFGPFAESNWQVPLEKLTHVQVVRRRNGKPEIYLHTNYSTFLVYGLDDVEELISQLPESISVSKLDGLREAIENGLDELHKELAHDTEQSVRDERVNELVRTTVKEFPDAQILVPDSIAAAKNVSKMFFFSSGAAVFYLWRAAHHIVWFIPIFVLGLRAYLQRNEKTSNCTYVICKDGLYEINRKRMFIDRINLADLKLDDRKSEGYWVRFSPFVEIPMQQIDSGFETLKLCVKDRTFKC